jgi:hypothetical protein
LAVSGAELVQAVSVAVLAGAGKPTASTIDGKRSGSKSKQVSTTKERRRESELTAQARGHNAEHFEEDGRLQEVAGNAAGSEHGHRRAGQGSHRCTNSDRSA